MSLDGMTRRSVLRGFAMTGVAGVAGYLVARNSGVASAKPVGTAANGYGYRPARSDSPRLLAPLAKVPPAGGGLILQADHVVLVRGANGDVHGLSATCTHQGCTVASVAAGRITCPCHGSSFDAGTGAVLSGPATRALSPVPVTVRAGNVYIA
jgi:Rieske Fe-S protein